MMSEQKDKIAVYGTLRRGDGDMGKLKRTSLVYPGHQTFPAIIQNSKGSGTVVEVRDVTEEQLMRYDMYEGVASGLYKRVKTDIDMEDGTKQKNSLGANAILSVSIAVKKLSAKLKKIPLYKNFLINKQLFLKVFICKRISFSKFLNFLLIGFFSFIFSDFTLYPFYHLFNIK